MMWYCFVSIVLTLHTEAYFPTWRLLVSFRFRLISVRESTVRAIVFQRRSEPLFFSVSVQSIGVQSHYFSEAFRAIIFQRRSEPLLFRVSVQSLGVQSHYFLEAFRAIIF